MGAWGCTYVEDMQVRDDSASKIEPKQKTSDDIPPKYIIAHISHKNILISNYILARKIK